jgi:hypothetical protein
MKTKQLLSLVVCICLTGSLLAQKITREFGQISMEELRMSSYNKDPLAEAVVLFDIGKSYFGRTQNGFEVIFERVTRIKILTDAGLDWATFEIPFYQEGDISEKVFRLDAFVYNLVDGQVKRTAMDRNSIYDEKLNQNWNLRKVALPDVSAGSVIEYSYKINSQYFFNLRDWGFQWKIPVDYSEYEIKITPFYEYIFILQGADRFSSQESFAESMKGQFGAIEYQNMVHRFTLKEIPAFRDEEYITSINDHIIKMNFQLSKINYPGGRVKQIMSTWPDMIVELDKHKDFGHFIRRSEKLAAKAIDIKLIKNQPENDRFDFIMNHMKETFKWNNTQSKFASKSPNDFLKDQFGNSADINLFAIGMLKAAGIEAHPIIMSTRNNGFIYKEYPFSNFFNYVLISAVVNGEPILADASSLLTANDKIPLKCVNKEGLLVLKGVLKWVDLRVSEPSEMKVDLKLSFKNQQMMVYINQSATEYEGVRSRVNYGDDIDHLKKKLKVTGFDILESTIEVSNQKDLNKPWNLSYSMKSEIDYSTEKLLIAPFLDLVLQDNPLKQNNRTYPIDMIYPLIKEFRSQILIPEGYRVEHIPQNRNYDSQHFHVKYEVLQEEGMLSIVFSYGFKKSVYEASLYPRLKTYFNEIVRRGNENIVLTRISDEG